MIKKVAWFALIFLCIWLSQIVPVTTIVSLLAEWPLRTSWVFSLVFVPPFMLLLASIFRGRLIRLKPFLVQYLGASLIAFSAAMIGLLLSLITSSFSGGVAALIACGLFCTYAAVAARRVQIVRKQITVNHLGTAVRALHLSDIHVGSRSAAFLASVVAQAVAENPDVVFITGDLVDELPGEQDLDALKLFNCPVLYCSGNHERYIDYEKTLERIALAGVRVLRDDSMVVAGLEVIGVEDRDNLQEASQALADTCAVIENKPATSLCRILLYHQPDIWPAAIEHGVKLTLAGHTHNGQIWPFGLLVRMRFRHIAGFYNQGDSHLVVSQGTGTWGPTLRFGTRCEFAVLDLQPA